MKRLCVILGAFVLGILLVGSVDARPHRPGHRSGHQSRYPGTMFWKWRLQLPGQWLPQSTPLVVDADPTSGTDDPAPGVSDPTSGTIDPNAGGDDPTSGTYQPGGVVGGVKSPRPAVTPKGGNQPVTPKGGNQLRLQQFNNGSPPMFVTPARRR
jgi:hypothetical protein